MGCDIKVFAERKQAIKKSFWDKLFFWRKQKHQWLPIEKWSVADENESPDDWEGIFHTVKREDRIYTKGRNYNLFSALCGVRSESFTGQPPRISDPKGLPGDTCQEIINWHKAFEDDQHSHSWNTLQELYDFDWSEYGETCNAFLDEVTQKLYEVMVEYKLTADDVRIVYSFDN